MVGGTRLISALTVAVLVATACSSAGGRASAPEIEATGVPTTAPVPTPAPTPTPSPAIERSFTSPDPDPPATVWYDASSIGVPYSDAVNGVLTFRGSPTRSYYGRGPVPTSPRVQWSYPERAMCSQSTDQDGTREWCGTGWTGQPAVWSRTGGLWVAFGAYDRRVHVLDAVTGVPRLAPFQTGDLIKGSVTIDPDGHPLIYVGSRDNFLRVLSYDTGELLELWSLDAASIAPSKWNDDWDGAPVVLDDHLLVGGENSNFHVIRLNRGYDVDGNVTAAPELLSVVPGWDDELLAAVGSNVSIENSVTIVDDVAYFANSGGLVQGWDIAPVRDGEPPQRTFRFWIGDDTDATVVVDDEGFLYAAAEFERGNERSRSLGQVVKLDPSRPDDPLIWSAEARTGLDTGVWATLAVYRDIVIVPAADGRVLALDRETGTERWALRLPGPVWSSPVIVDDVLVQGDCGGELHAYDLSNTAELPPELWSVVVGGCIESTPVVWEGRIWVGTRGGFFHMIAD